MADVEASPAPVKAAKGTPNIDNMSIADLKALSERIAALIVQKQAETKDALIEEFRRRAEEAGLSLESLMQRPAPVQRGPKSSGSGAGGKVAIKYRGPNGETWSGRGRTPTWITASGKNKEDFAV